MARGTWSKAERAQLVGAYAEAFEALRAASLEIDLPGGEAQDPDALRLFSQSLQHQLWQLSEAYLDGLPRQTMARCPYTAALSRVSFDPLGLDGPFWARQQPIRPKTEPEAGDHFIGLTGALRLEGPTETAPFLVAPGPAAPFVIPRLFERQEVVAVLTEGHVGGHRAYAVSYFAADPKHAHRRPRLWGAKFKPQPAPPDPGAPETDDVEDYDFDLRPWLEKNKLAWVAPGDHDRKLHYGTQNCPYLDLPGPRELQYVQYGKVWT